MEKEGRPSNLLLLHEHASSVLCHLIPESSISRVFILYPNPYPKAKHLNQRWHAHSIMHRILKVLCAEGEVLMRSNIESYMIEAKEYFQDHWNLKVNHLKSFSKEDQKDPWTHFEKKYLDRGQKCFELSVCKPLNWKKP